MQYFDLGIDYLDRYDDYIEAVTREKVGQLAARLLDPEKLTVVVVGKPKGVVPNAPTPEIGGEKSARDRESGASGRSGAVNVELGGRRNYKKNNIIKQSKRVR